jgi:uroporphyrinogen-III decarboxylase
MKQNFEGKRYNGLPIKVGYPGNLAGTHGLFTTAVEVRGHARLLAEMRTDPEFVKSLLEVISEKIIEHIKAWYQLVGEEKKLPSPDTWGMADDSLQMLSPRLYKDFVLPFHKKMYAEMTTGTRMIHLCGHSEQHFKTLYDELGIRVFDGPGPWINIGWMRDEFGTDTRINAQVYHQKLKEGSPQDIESMISGILTKKAKRGGYMTLLGYAVNGVPLENLEMMYKFGLKYGSVD